MVCELAGCDLTPPQAVPQFTHYSQKIARWVASHVNWLIDWLFANMSENGTGTYQTHLYYDIAIGHILNKQSLVLFFIDTKLHFKLVQFFITE